ncbi:MAG: YggT family protein [Gammaproteobacteria bacterium]|nr:YggT family protein [Gammaproteobacteria bacterium]MDD9825031.1 YggT family protein [Gammaproteobacteria bacterium]MDD9863160.1 YggT family protein [Gammaproteobacteria bacterium]
MEYSYFAQALEFLVRFFFGILLLLMFIRFLLELYAKRFYNPLIGPLIGLTELPLRPLRRCLPVRHGALLAPLLAMILLQGLELLLLSLLHGGGLPLSLGLLLLVVASLLRLAIYFYLVCIFLQVLLSWIRPHSYGEPLPVFQMLAIFTRPLLGPIRRRLPPVSGLDLSPLLAWVLLYLAMLLVHAPLHDAAVAMMARS